MKRVSQTKTKTSYIKQNPENSQKIEVESRTAFSFKYHLVLVVEYGCKSLL